MSLGKRHIGRRVAGVGVGVALMVLGLEAPAFAVAPTITSFTPTSGPAGCVFTITGTNFLNPAVTAVDIGGIAVDNFAVNSDTEIWAEVDAGTATGTVHVTNGSGTANSATNFTVPASGAGGCAPTVTSFTPTCGGSGTVVTITGTNLLDNSDPAAFPTQVRFVNAATGTYDNDAQHTIPNAETPTTLSVLVPSGQTDGPIRVTTAVDLDFGPTPFQVPPPDCVAGAVGHARAITFKLKKSGKASGVLSSTEDPAFTACAASQPVKIQKKKKGGGWKTKANATTTDTGSYSAKIPGKPGKYRALAPKVEGTTDPDDCLKAKSATRKIG